MSRRYALVNDYGLRGAGMWALGYDGGHGELYRALAESFLVDKSAPQAGIKVARAASRATRASSSAGRRATPARSSRTTSRCRSTAARWRPWLTATRSDLGRLARRGRTRATRSGSGRGTARATPGAGTSASTWDATPSLASGGFARVVEATVSPTARAPTPSSARLGSLTPDTIVAITRGPVSQGRLSPGTRSPSRSASGRPCRSSSAASGSRRSRRRPSTSAATAPELDHRRRRHPAPRLRGRGPRPASGPARPSWRCPRVLAQP